MTGRKTAIVTGGNKGLGRVIAAHLAQHGYDIALVFGHDVKAAEESAAIIRGHGGRCELYPLDLRRRDQIEAMVGQVRDAFGGMDGLVNCAGSRALAPLVDLSEEDWDSVVAINLKAPFLLCQAVARVMLEQRRGAIVNIGAASGHRPRAGGGAYTATKAGLKALTEQMAVEWGPSGVRVNLVSPGAIETPGAWVNTLPGYDKHAQLLPLRRKGNPDEIAAAVAFLLSSEAGYITGHSLIVDGGGVHTWYLNQ